MKISKDRLLDYQIISYRNKNYFIIHVKTK